MQANSKLHKWFQQRFPNIADKTTVRNGEVVSADPSNSDIANALIIASESWEEGYDQGCYESTNSTGE